HPGTQRARRRDVPVLPGRPWDGRARNRDLRASPWGAAEVAGLGKRGARGDLPLALFLARLLRGPALVPRRQHLGDQAGAGGAWTGGRLGPRRRGGAPVAPPRTASIEE